MTSHLVVGHRGQVGAAVSAAIEQRTGERVVGFDLADKRPAFARWDVFDILHVCIPGDAPDFAAAVAKYQRMVRPDVTIVYSSTPVGTCEALGAVHSPIEGQHHAGGILRALLSNQRPLGSSDAAALYKAAQVWDDAIVINSASVTEFLKLRSTTLYGLLIVFARYTADALVELGAVDEAAALTYDRWYNDVYADRHELHRPILTAPVGPIGGHCVVPNAGLLERFRTSTLVRAVATFNDRFRREERAS